MLKKACMHPERRAAILPQNVVKGGSVDRLGLTSNHEGLREDLTLLDRFCQYLIPKELLSAFTVCRFSPAHKTLLCSDWLCGVRVISLVD